MAKPIPGISEKDILNYLIENSILDLDGVQAEINRKGKGAL